MNLTEVCSFLRFTNYYCKFIKKYAQVVKPLYKLISGENVVRKCNSVKWDPECQDAFDKLKELCTSTPVLAYLDFKKLFKLHIHYKSGKSSVEADALSRIDQEKCDETIQTDSIQAIVAAAIAGD